MSNSSKVKIKNARVNQTTNTPSADKINIKMPRVTLTCSKEAKSCSCGLINKNNKLSIAKPRKTTKSDVCFNDQNLVNDTLFDYCKKCGDGIARKPKEGEKKSIKSQSTRVEEEDDVFIVFDSNESSKTTSSKNSDKLTKTTVKLVKSRSSTRDITANRQLKSSVSSTNCNISQSQQRPKSALRKPIIPTKTKIKAQPVKQYYKNKNFKQTSNSAFSLHNNIKKTSHLDTIKELPESTLVEDINFVPDNSNSDKNILSDSDDDDDRTISGDEPALLDPNDFNALKKLRDFRKKNYFECHSAKARIESKASVTSLVDHKCVYRFYLNDRLFPVPLNTDHENNIRCTECYLPLNFKDGKVDMDNVNGTIQAKVKLNSQDDAQDIVLVLPVKEPLIISEKRREKKPAEEEVVYFGIVNLNHYGNLKQFESYPSDSLALKYQKGYKEFVKSPQDCLYEKTDDFQVIVV